jgi:hypothetical protein
LGWPPAPHWANISSVAMSIFVSSSASDQLYVVWDSSKDKATGSDNRLAYKRYYNLVRVVRRSNLGWPPAPHWANISSVAMSISTSTAASDQVYVVWDDN